jgi:monothiol glutaredoxin
MGRGAAASLRTQRTGETVAPATIALIIISPFIVIFVWAAWLEFDRYRRHGPTDYNRSMFEIDEDAPSYEPPPEETDDIEEGSTTMEDAKTRIEDTVKSNDVVLYMKGTKSMPQCGFSSRVAGVLNYMGVEFQDVNVLEDEEIRQGIKDYSDWPTIPQLYVKGEFVGGCDIITEMTLSGELDQLLDDKGVAYDKDAADKIREANA